MSPDFPFIIDIGVIIISSLIFVLIAGKAFERRG
jgi:hypothetical protein